MKQSKLRFAVGQENGPYSASWTLWTRGDDVYLAERGLGHVTKYSFHQSGLCRSAFLKPLRADQDRATLKWKRSLIPPKGLAKGELLARIYFPTNHLSLHWKHKPGPIRWIVAAGEDRATVIDIFLTNEEAGHVEKQLGAHRVLVHHSALASGGHIALAACDFDCGPVDIGLPGRPRKEGQVFGSTIFPNVDSTKSGRPIRMTISPGTPPPLELWELGGYETNDEVAQRFSISREKVLRSRDDSESLK